MRLSEWRKTAPNKEALSGKVMAMLRPVLEDLGAESDAECWVAWGDDPESRYSVLAPTDAGLISISVRLTGVDGPRATAKLIRWTKVSVSELGLESSGGSRIVAVQVESLVLKGMDDEADRICEFVRGLIAGIDGRLPTSIPLAVVQAAALGGVAVSAPPKVEPKPKIPSPAESVAPAAVPATPKPARAAAPKTVPESSKTTAKAAPPKAARAADKPAGLALVPPAAPAAPSGVPVPAKPAEPAAPLPPPTPIAARAAAAHQIEPPAQPAKPAAPPDPESDRSDWIGPHPIEEPVKREPTKSRPWQP
jgi:hypothetical protein